MTIFTRRSRSINAGMTSGSEKITVVSRARSGVAAMQNVHSPQRLILSKGRANSFLLGVQIECIMSHLTPPARL
jgi:hypothetical protein